MLRGYAVKAVLSIPVIIDERRLEKRTRELAKQIQADFGDEPFVAIGVLKGAFVFFADLTRYLGPRVHCEFLALKSYGTHPASGEKQILLDIQDPLVDKHLLLVLDLVDTGFEMDFLRRTLEARHPGSLKTCALLVRRASLRKIRPPDHIGFELGEEFVAGYGIDFQGRYRQLPYVGRVTGEVLEP